MGRQKFTAAAGIFALVGFAGMAATATSAPPPPEFELTIKNHTFQPAALKVPRNIKFKLRVINEDATVEEFESNDFSRESIVLPNHSAVVFIGPLRAGTYQFFGDFHRELARGQLIVE